MPFFEILINLFLRSPGPQNIIYKKINRMSASQARLRAKSLHFLGTAQTIPNDPGTDRGSKQSKII